VRTLSKIALAALHADFVGTAESYDIQLWHIHNNLCTRVC
jgi:hypothetical protein